VTASPSNNRCAPTLGSRAVGSAVVFATGTPGSRALSFDEMLPDYIPGEIGTYKNRGAYAATDEPNQIHDVFLSVMRRHVPRQRRAVAAGVFAMSAKAGSKFVILSLRFRRRRPISLVNAGGAWNAARIVDDNLVRRGDLAAIARLNLRPIRPAPVPIIRV